MNQIVCISHEPWSAFPTRTQHLITRLRDTQVLYFQPCGGDRREYRARSRRVRTGVTLYTLPYARPYDELQPRMYYMGQQRVARYIESVLDRHRIRDPLLWTTSPEQVQLLEIIPHRALIYDCDRDWSALPIRWESDLTLAADLVFAASRELADHLAPCNDNIVLIPNGSNHPMFCRDDLPVPPEMRGLSRPVFGWAGRVAADLDLYPLWYTATRHPDWNFLLFGWIEPGNPLLSRVLARPNVRHIALDSLVDLPEYVTHCDVCIDLIRTRERGLGVIPNRIYEYLSAGKPVVTMIWPDQVEQFPDVIYAAHTPEEFCHLCETALTESPGWVTSRRRAYGERFSWSNRAAEVSRILTTAGYC